jgi:uncharacterized protein YhaN
MKISSLKVHGFGIWSGLSLDGLSEELNVFCGPNEAGKTTLLQFVRAVLYGFSPERMQYLPPVRGGRPGGLIDIASQQGSFQVSRHADHTDKSGRAPAVLIASDGSRQPEPLLNQILCNIDETVFKNVFAFGLQEIQQLGSLGDTEAAELLFSLSTGLDRVSLVDVMRELDVSRCRLLSDDGASGQIVQLLADRKRISQEIKSLSSLTSRYGRIASQRNRLDRDLGRLEEEKSCLRHDIRCIEIAVAIRPRWDARAATEARLGELRLSGTMPDGAVSRLERIDTALNRHSDKISRLGRQRRRLRAEAGGIEINEELCRQSARVEALREQENWLGTLESRCAELELETEKIHEDLAAEYERFGFSAATPQAVLPVLDHRKSRSLRKPLNTLRRERHELGEAQKAAATATAAALAAEDQIKAALASRGESELSAAIDSAGELVAQFRRRAQIDERFAQMEQYRAELDAQSRRLLGRQVMPAWTLVGLGAVFVVGVILLVAGLFASSSITGGFGWVLSTIGLLGLIAGVAAKFFIEHSNANQLDACQKQLNMLHLQLQEADQQRDQLDASLPAGGTPLQERLNSAQSDLAALEQLMPLDAQRQAALHEAEAARARAVRAEENISQSRRRWREALQAAGLPEKLSPKQVQMLSRRRGRLDELAGRLQRSREELKQRGDELRGISGRIYQLANDTGVLVDGDQPAPLLARLSEQLKQQQSLLARRQTLRGHLGSLRQSRAKHEKAIRRLKRHRRELFEQAGAVDEHDFRKQAGRRAKAETMLHELETARAEIVAAIGDHCPESEIAGLLDSFTSETLENRWEQESKRLEEIDVSVREQLEKRGRLAEKMKNLAEDRRPAERQLEHSMVKQRLKQAIRRWRVLALTGRILHGIRLVYEKDRQPATLQEASGYLNRLTQGRYTRVWTPLGEDVLRVDDASGTSLPCEVLSRGTREQLFLSLRLALVSSYASRGAKLPLILDDVLVNFDTIRAKAAAEVLADFARTGHQLLVFTCHDHILKLFRSLKVQVSRLPGNDGQPDAAPEVIDVSATEPPDAEQPEAEPPAKPARTKRPAKKNTRKSKQRKRPEPELIEPEPIEQHDDSDQIEDTEDAPFDAADVDNFEWEEVSEEPDSAKEYAREAASDKPGDEEYEDEEDGELHDAA